MPGSGCPILDEGRIVVVFYDPGTNTITGQAFISLSITTTGCDGECTWQEGGEVSLRRDADSQWQATRASRVWMT